MNLKIFVLTPDDIRLSRRIKRDITDRGRTVKDVLEQYCRFVKPAYDGHIKPMMKYADIVIPYWNKNKIATDIVVTTLQKSLLNHNIQTGNNKEVCDFFSAQSSTTGEGEGS